MRKKLKFLRIKEVSKRFIVYLGNHMYWKGENEPKIQPRYYYYYKSSAKVEMTAYALLAILRQSEDDQNVVTDEIMDIIRWLSAQRNSYGGFSSTQVKLIYLKKPSYFGRTRAYKTAIIVECYAKFFGRNSIE